MADKLKNLVMENKWLLLMLLALIAFPYIHYQPYLLSLLISIFIFGALAVSYDLLLGFTGLISFGHALFFGMGAYGVGLLSRHTDFSFPLIFLIIVVIAVIIAFVKAVFAMRVRGIYFAMITLALAQFFFVLTIQLSSITGGEDGLPRVPHPEILGTRIAFYFAALAFLFLVYVCVRRLVNSPTGRVLIGIRDNEDRMVMLGFNVFKYKFFSLSVAGIIGCFAGALYVMFINIAYPGLLDIQRTIDVLMMTIVGGVGTLHGPIFGAALVQLLSHYLSSYFRQWIIIFGFIYIAIVVFMPRGIFGGLPGLALWLEKREGVLKRLGKRLK